MTVGRVIFRTAAKTTIQVRMYHFQYQTGDISVTREHRVQVQLVSTTFPRESSTATNARSGPDRGDALSKKKNDRTYSCKLVICIVPPDSALIKPSKDG